MVVPMDRLMSGMALAEMTGQFNTKLEETATIIMRILVKMKLTNNIMWQNVQTSTAADALYKILWNERNALEWYSSQEKKPGPSKGQLKMYTLTPDVGPNICKAIDTIEKLRKMYSVDTTKNETFVSKFRPWDTLKLLVMFFLHASMNMERFLADRLGVEDLPQEIERTR